MSGVEMEPSPRLMTPKLPHGSIYCVSPSVAAANYGVTAASSQTAAFWTQCFGQLLLHLIRGCNSRQRSPVKIFVVENGRAGHAPDSYRKGLLKSLTCETGPLQTDKWYLANYFINRTLANTQELLSSLLCLICQYSFRVCIYFTSPR